VVLLAVAVLVVLALSVSLLGTLAGLRILRSKADAGERLVAKRLQDLEPNSYHVFHDLYLPYRDGPGTTQLDHVVISKFGVFVIETKYLEGWVFGDAGRTQWTQSAFGSNRQFPNPLHRNQLHVAALKKFLGLSEWSFHSLVFFVDGEFRAEMPENVICSDLCGWITSRRSPLLSDEALQEALRKVEELDKATDRKAAKASYLQCEKEREESGTAGPPSPGVGERSPSGASVPEPLRTSPWAVKREPAREQARELTPFI